MREVLPRSAGPGVEAMTDFTTAAGLALIAALFIGVLAWWLTERYD